MKIADFLDAADVLRLTSSDKPKLLAALARHASERLSLDAAAIGRALAEREVLGSTGVGHGVALPHARLGYVRRPYGAFAALGKPVEFGAVDDRPVDLVFLLLLPAHVPEDQLRCLACAARRLKGPGLLEQIRTAREPSRIYDLLLDG